MKKRVLAALVIAAMASCSKESTTLDTTPVEVTFAAASITRVANNEWESGDKIGVTMTKTTTTELASGDYSNVPYTVAEASATGKFSADSKVIYFPTDGSAVDFYAYCPYTTLDSSNDIEVSVATQNFTKIDLVAAIASGATKSSPTVIFTDDKAFKHQLSKLSITMKLGDGVSDLTGLTTTIKGQYTTAKYNLFTSDIASKGDIADITAVTTVATTTTVEAILIPTSAVSGSSIVFSLSGDDYVWDTSALALIQGSEHKYEITITKTGVVMNGATITTWGDGTDGTGTAE
ncbi:MAG: fimbrillin family protein [Rikenellaceae bacterium]